MNDPIFMAIVQGICEGLHNFANFWLVFTLMKIFLIAEFTSLHKFHHNIEVIFIIVYFINFDYIRMLQLNI